MAQVDGAIVGARFTHVLISAAAGERRHLDRMRYDIDRIVAALDRAATADRKAINRADLRDRGRACDEAGLAMNRVSRREFVRLGAAGVVAPFVVVPARLGAAALTAQAIVDRIQHAVGVEWQATTVDTFKAGDPSTVVTGVVTTSLATIDVMRRAVQASANLIITSGPTFYSRADSAPPPSADPVWTAKQELIKRNNLVVWRFSDHWRLRTPNPFAQGLTAALGWAKDRAGNDPARVTVPAVTLDALVTDVKATLNARGGMRIIGNPQTRVRRIGVVPGTVPIQGTLELLPEVDVIIAGEIREWESSEYVRDTVSAGFDKGLILLGRTVSEDPGMKVCSAWLQTIVPEVPCRWTAVADPYWRPTA